MIRIAEACREWRATHPVLRNVGVNWRTKQEGDRTGITSEIDVSVQPSETNAVVPCTVIERIKSGDGALLGNIVQALSDCLSGGVFFGEHVVIHRHILAGVDIENDAGPGRVAVLKWVLEASWRPLAGGA